MLLQLVVMEQIDGRTRASLGKTCKLRVFDLGHLLALVPALDVSRKLSVAAHSLFGIDVRVTQTAVKRTVRNLRGHTNEEAMFAKLAQKRHHLRDEVKRESFEECLNLQQLWI